MRRVAGSFSMLGIRRQVNLSACGSPRNWGWVVIGTPPAESGGNESHFISRESGLESGESRQAGGSTCRVVVEDADRKDHAKTCAYTDNDVIDSDNTLWE
jgi:hypothetical protein